MYLRRTLLVAIALSVIGALFVVACAEHRCEIDLYSGRIRSGYYIGDVELASRVTDTLYSRKAAALFGSTGKSRWRLVNTTSFIMPRSPHYSHHSTPDNIRIIMRVAEDVPKDARRDVQRVVAKDVQSMLKRDEPSELSKYSDSIYDYIEDLRCSAFREDGVDKARGGPASP